MGRTCSAHTGDDIVLILIWKFELKGEFGIVLRYRGVDDIVIYLRVKGHRNVDCIELEEFCGCSNAGNVLRS
jgi:hypothetical protein